MMGADGSTKEMKESVFRTRFPDIDPAELGLRRRSLSLTCPHCGGKVEEAILYFYSDTNGISDLDYGTVVNLAENVRTWQAQLARVQAKGNDGVLVVKSMFMPERTWRASELDPLITQGKSDPGYQHSVDCLEAQEWFCEHAEENVLWT